MNLDPVEIINQKILSAAEQISGLNLSDNDRQRIKKSMAMLETVMLPAPECRMHRVGGLKENDLAPGWFRAANSPMKNLQAQVALAKLRKLYRGGKDVGVKLFPYQEAFIVQAMARSEGVIYVQQSADDLAHLYRKNAILETGLADAIAENNGRTRLLAMAEAEGLGFNIHDWSNLTASQLVDDLTIRETAKQIRREMRRGSLSIKDEKGVIKDLPNDMGWTFVPPKDVPITPELERIFENVTYHEATISITTDEELDVFLKKAFDEKRAAIGAETFEAIIMNAPAANHPLIIDRQTYDELADPKFGRPHEVEAKITVDRDDFPQPRIINHEGR